MSNPYFDHRVSPSRLADHTLARAEDINDRLDEVSQGFDGLHVHDLAAIKAPDGETLGRLPAAVTRALKTILFDVNGDLGVAAIATGEQMDAAVAAALAAIGWFTIVPVSAPQLLAVKTRYHVDSSGGALALQMPAAAVAGDYLIVVDITGSAALNNITLTANGLNVYGSAQDYVMDLANEALVLIYDATQGWVRT